MELHERLIVRSAIKELLSHGFRLSVFDGGKMVLKHSTDPAAVLAAMGTTDEDMLFVSHPDFPPTPPAKARYMGSVIFLYGNEPGVVMADYGANLEAYLTITNAVAEAIGEEGQWL